MRFPELIDTEMDYLYSYLEEKLIKHNFIFKDGARPKATDATYEFKDFIHNGEELTSLIRYDKSRTITFVEDITTTDTDYFQLQSYTDKFENIDSAVKIDEVLVQLGLEEEDEEDTEPVDVLESYKKTLSEALENYHDERKWEALLQDLADCYEYGAHTEAYIEICKFFQYEDLLKTFLRLKKYRDRNHAYIFGDPEYQEQYDTFEIMMDRLKSEIPNEEDYEAIRQFV